MENSIYSKKCASSHLTKGTISMCRKNPGVEDPGLTIKEVTNSSMTTSRASTPRKANNTTDTVAVNNTAKCPTITRSRGSNISREVDPVIRRTDLVGTSTSRAADEAATRSRLGSSTASLSTEAEAAALTGSVPITGSSKRQIETPIEGNIEYNKIFYMLK